MLMILLFGATFTSDRVIKCCPKAFKTKYHGVAEHIWLRDPKMRSFMDQVNIKGRSQKPFRFTLLRNPVDQLISYFEYVSRHKHPFYAAMKQATKAIEIKHQADEYVGLAKFLLRVKEDPQFSSDEALLNLTALITNSQAKELGWNGTSEDLPRVKEFLETLDFVGITEELPEIHENILPALLGWDHDLFFTDNIITKHYFCTIKTREQLKEVQFADMVLYKKARELYFKEVRRKKYRI